MLFKTKLILIFTFICSCIHADSLRYNSNNNHGSVGLINMPTARFHDESTTAITLYNGNPDKKFTLTLSPYNWLEASVFYTSIDNVPYGSGFDQDYKDKGFNTKFRLKKEGRYPALAIGFNDFAGTGIYSSEYIVSSYAIDNIDFHLGLGWGLYDGGRFSFNNFLTDLNKDFSTRNYDSESGGRLRTDDFFSGEQIGVFGGISFVNSNKWIFKYEYDSSKVPAKFNIPNRTSNHSFNAEYIYSDNFNFGISFERGDYFGFKFNWKDNSKKFNPTRFKKRTIKSENEYENLRYTLYKNNIGVNKIIRNQEDLYVDITENTYHSKKELTENIERSIAESGISVEEVLITYTTAGLIGSTDEFTENQGNELYINNFEPIYNQSFGFNIRPFLAAREEFFKFALLGEYNSQFIFSRNLFWTNNFKYTFIDNFDGFYAPPVDTYPNQVRSDIKDYLKNFGNRWIIGRSQIDYYKTINKDHHFQFTAGVLEEMFNGYGFEYLWSNSSKNYSLGFEIFDVQKRDYDLRFGTLEYENMTGHFNFYYSNNYLVPFDIHLSYGEYLAGDQGYTIDISRKFPNGVSMGGFFTKTNVTYDQFGEGSFDKGIYFKIPIGQEWFNFLWRPLTKDPGAKLVRKDNLYTFLRKYQN